MILTSDEREHIRKLVSFYRGLPKTSMGVCANFPWNKIDLLIADYESCEQYYNEHSVSSFKAAQTWMNRYDELLAKISAHPDWMAELIKEEQKKGAS